VLFVLCLIFQEAGPQSVDPNSQPVQCHRLQRYGLHTLCSVGKQRLAIDVAAAAALEACRRVLNADLDHGWHLSASLRLHGWRTSHRSVLALGWGLPQRCRAVLVLELAASEPTMLPLQRLLHRRSPRQAASPGASQQPNGFRPCSSAVAGPQAPHQSPHHHWCWPQLLVANRSDLAGCGAHLVVQVAVLAQLEVEACYRLKHPLQMHTGLPQGLVPHRPQLRRYLARSSVVSERSPSPLTAGHHRARECHHVPSSQPYENGQGPLGQPQSTICHRHHAAAPSCLAGILVLGLQALPVRTQPERRPCRLLVFR